MSSIKALDSGSYQIIFDNKADEPTKSLVLISDHVHLGIEPGQQLRLSAEVLREGKENIEVSQVLLFLPGEYGATPVWMLSQNASSYELKGAKFLDMHSPSADFTVF